MLKIAVQEQAVKLCVVFSDDEAPQDEVPKPFAWFAPCFSNHDGLWAVCLWQLCFTWKIRWRRIGNRLLRGTVKYVVEA
jgi:hypothetical protein